MQKIIPSYEGEVWCISKHLLASAMRLMEVGTKQQSLNHPEEAYRLFNQAYELYCLFWGLNMNMLNVDDVKWIEDKSEDIKNFLPNSTLSSGKRLPAPKNRRAFQNEGLRPQSRRLLH